jgi:hypothetical protein
MDQPRHPPGTPPGGRFLARLNPETADVDLRELLPDDEHNADGTYWFPPAPRSARQAIGFWMTVEVPDRVLRQLRDAHRQVRRQAQFHHEVVPEIPRSDLRAVVRIAKLYGHAAQLREEEFFKVERCRFTLESGQTFSPAKLIDHYKLHEVENVIVDSPEDREEAKQREKTYDTFVEIRDLLASLPDRISIDFPDHYHY